MNHTIGHSRYKDRHGGLGEGVTCSNNLDALPSHSPSGILCCIVELNQQRILKSINKNTSQRS